MNETHSLTCKVNKLKKGADAPVWQYFNFQNECGEPLDANIYMLSV